jgi:choline dehydrogenase-like flavoprotein
MGSPIGANLLTPLIDMAQKSEQTPFDAIVVGAGSAGITVARTLAEKGKRVALLESGPLALLSHIQSTDLRFDVDLAQTIQRDLQYSAAGADGKPFGALIGCVGGRGLFWNGAAPRFAPSDFTGWPLTIEDLVPHYEWAERELRVTRSYSDSALCQTICRLLRRAGINAEPGPYAVDNHPTAAGWLAGTVGNSLAPLLRSTLLTSGARLISLATRAFARKIIFSSRTATGIEAVDLDTSKVYSIQGKAVVLAAGGFESVRLAMVSCVPDAAGLLGRYISDHMFVRAYYPMPPQLYDSMREEVAIGWVPANHKQRYQIEIHLPSDNLFLNQAGARWSPDESTFYAAMVRSFAAVEPRRDNFIEPLSGDVPGSFRVHFNLDDNDIALRQSQLDGIESVRAALGARPATAQVMPQGSSHHEAGGLMMGLNPASSIVDGYGRFHHANQLYVADAAAWPDVSPANPHLTIIAIARRMATTLASRL